MADLPLISVIIPVYNVARYLDDCMQSVLAQTYQNLQIILVDDGSKDESGAMCDRWASIDPRIRVIHQENRGLSGARNAGLDVCTGAYILFVDSDDVLSPRLCQTLLDALDGSADIAICDPVHIFPGTAWAYTDSGSRTVMDAVSAINAMWYQSAFLPSAWGKLYRSSLWKTRRFTEGRLFEDIDIMHEVLFDANTVVYDDSRLYGYLHREDSITTKAFGPRDLDILLIADKLLAFVREKPQLQAAARAYAVTAALRVYLNAPDTPQLRQGIDKAKSLLATYGRQVHRDPNIRKKNRYALTLYFFCKPLMRLIYKFINRWK